MTLVEMATKISTPKIKRDKLVGDFAKAIGQTVSKPAKKSPLPRKPAAVAATATNPLDIPADLDRTNGKPLDIAEVDALNAKAAKDRTIKSPRPTTASLDPKLDETRMALAAKVAAEKKQKAIVRIQKLKAKQSGATKEMPKEGNAAREAIARVTLITPKTENGDSRKVADAIKNGHPVKKVPTGQTAEKVLEAETAKRRAAQTADVRRAEVNKRPSKTPKVIKKASSKKKPARGVGTIAKESILAGKTNEQALVAVMKAFPDCSSNLGCMSWYRNDLRKKGLLKSAQ